MTSIQELYSKSKLRKQPIAPIVPEVIAPVQVVEPEPEPIMDSPIVDDYSALVQRVSDLEDSVGKCQKSKIADEYNAFVVTYNDSMQQIQDIILDLSTRLANAGF